MDRCDGYTITSIKEIPIQPINDDGNEIVADILNHIIDNICLRDELQQTKKLEVVDL